MSSPSSAWGRPHTACPVKQQAARPGDHDYHALGQQCATVPPARGQRTHISLCLFPCQGTEATDIGAESSRSIQRVRTLYGR